VLTATAGAAEASGRPHITGGIPGVRITEPNDDQIEPSKTAQHFSDGDFFAPKELHELHGATTPKRDAVEGEGAESHPSVPKIVVIEPEATNYPSAGQMKPALKKTPPLVETTGYLEHDTSTRPRLRERTKSATTRLGAERQRDSTKSNSPRVSPKNTRENMPTSSSWVLTEKFPKGGWSMKARCSATDDADFVVDIVVVYLFNSALTEAPHDPDSDLDLFVHSSPIDNEKSISMPLETVQRAKTDLGRQPPERKHTSKGREPQDRRVNWLQDRDMIRKHISGSRIITVGFDITAALSTSPSPSMAAGQLREYLQKQRERAQRRPIIFLGHTLGGSFILDMLCNMSSMASSSCSILSNTAGLFLFPWPVAHSEFRHKSFASLYGIKSSDKMFEDLSGTSMLRRLKEMGAGLCAQYPQVDDVWNGPACLPKTRQGVGCIVIGFPIFEVFARRDNKESKGPVADTPSLFLDTPVRSIIIRNDTSNVFKFPSPDDPDYLRLAMSIQTALQAHRLLHAAAGGHAKKVLALIREGINVNLHDRWAQTALQIAVRKSDEDMVLALLKADGLDVNVRDRKSNTPLHYAIRGGNEAIIRTLLHHDADIGLENKRKLTPRDLAEKHRSRKHIAKLLKSRLMQGPDQSSATRRIGTGALPASEEGQLACKSFQVTVTEIYSTVSSDKHWSVNISIEALLYGSTSLDDILAQVRPRAVHSETPVCIWIHVPENNMVWLEDLLARKLGIQRAIWQDTAHPVFESIRNRAITPHIGSGEIRSIFMPYLSYELNHRQIKRTAYVRTIDKAFRERADSTFGGVENSGIPLAMSSHEKSREQSHFLQVPDGPDTGLEDHYPYSGDDSDSDFSEMNEVDDPDDLEEEEKALISTYLHSPPSLHVRRTLDQYFYHMLENTDDRDKDQVVSRWAQKVRSETRHNILMVDQLWLWLAPRHAQTRPEAQNWDGRVKIPEGETNPRSKNDYVISCFPNRTGTGQSGGRKSDDLRLLLRLLVLDPDRLKRDPIWRPDDLVSRILETCCGVFDRFQSVEMLSFFQMFEDSIGSIDDRENQLLRDFQRGSTRLLELNSANKFYNEQKDALLTDLLDIREEIRLLVEIKDMQEEINIILSVLDIQLGLVLQLSGPSEEGAFPFYSTVRNTIKTDIDDFQKLYNYAGTIQGKLNSLMDLKQKAANAWEAREARETAVATGKQGNTLMVFTVVTIIFLPLSFMSSFFAIGVATFPRDAASGEVSWPLRSLLGILFGVSLAVSTPLIIFALNMDYCSSLYQELRNNYLALLGTKLIGLLPTLDPNNELGTRRKRWSGKLQKTREEYLKQDDSGPRPENTHEDESTMHDMKVAASQSFPSSISFHTSPEDDKLQPPEKKNRGGRLRIWRRKPQ
jgi:ankyrin repeat protein